MSTRDVTTATTTPFTPGPTPAAPTKDVQTVDPEGRPVAPRIHGVNVRPALTISDERGSICEMFSPAWNYHPSPLVYVYQITIRPGQVKGWVYHKKQDDRLFFSTGEIQTVLYDGREDSPTYGVLNEFVFGDNNRALVTIPAGVWHALRNIGSAVATAVNMPTRPFDHADPDKYRLPLDTPLIPYRFR